MKETNQKQPFYIGIDVSKLTIDVSLIHVEGFHQHQQFANSKMGFILLHNWLQGSAVFTYSDALFCMEHTGIYTRQLVMFLLSKGAKVWMESALHLKRSMGMTRERMIRWIHSALRAMP